ncbi:hypothetical protein GCM10007170_41970 [Arthrobacter liuii]|uniref:Uncharacterized protein n=1 Tax=Arthrobacter liuii TaxID=1476996 RepID=A0ABQ2B0M0_9MICC|nr:hypothetical protein GCM10007170_41970 [Arthrobacter liuii]
MIAAFVGNPIGLLVFSAVINGIAAAPFLIVTMLISGDRKIMGRYRTQCRPGFPPAPGRPCRGWDFVSAGRGDVPWEPPFRALTAIASFDAAFSSKD